MATAKKVVKKVTAKKVVTEKESNTPVAETKQFKCDNCEDSGLQCSVCNQNPDFAQ